MIKRYCSTCRGGGYVPKLDENDHIVTEYVRDSLLQEDIRRIVGQKCEYCSGKGVWPVPGCEVGL